MKKISDIAEQIWLERQRAWEVSVVEQEMRELYDSSAQATQEEMDNDLLSHDTSMDHLLSPEDETVATTSYSDPPSLDQEESE